MDMLMKSFNFPLLWSDDIFKFVGEALKDLDAYDSTGKSFGLRKFPKGDVFLDKDGNCVVEMALAGYDKEQLSVAVDNGQLIISAVKCDCSCGKEKDCCCGSRTLARRAFKQSFANLGDEYALEKADVNFKNGLLRIIIPKSEKTKVLSLEIK